ncbi:MAG TPA: hypothetical protein VHA52_02305 [Candidatus Babeliaceae bacterium]|nr:hypothetical protein [Candidatus Babeliaceae bacterium]
MADRFLIAPLTGGLETDLRPWLIPDSAFEQMNNAYIFRGRIKKRFGSRFMNPSISAVVAQLYSRLRIGLTGGSGVGITDALGNASGTVPGAVFSPGQLFSIGTQIFTVQTNGTPVTMLNTGAGTATYNTTTGAYIFTGVTASTQIYFYPATPVMALIQYQTQFLAQDPTYAFDTQFAYQFNPSSSGGWDRLGTALWTGSDSQFYWGATWQGADPSVRLLFIVNNKQADQIKYWDNTSWTTITPQYTSTATNTLETALIVVVFKNRLIFFNTTEQTTAGVYNTYTNRARWSAYGDPTATNAFRQDIAGQGNALDAATLEDIVSVEFIKDRLIVFFERSTWEFVYTGNQAQPFTWQQLNTELGAESTFSTVPFDKFCLTVGNVGIHECNGINVRRIDDKIPDTVWQVHTQNSGVSRIYGIRDYFAEQVYWTFPAIDTDGNSSTYPNKVLVFNYKIGSWAFNDDSITAFGYYYESSISAITWASTTITWENDEVTWATGNEQPLNENVLAGNQEGFVFIVDPDFSVNAAALQLSNIVLSGGNIVCTVYNHNFNDGDWISLSNLNGLTPVAPATVFNGNYQISFINDANTFYITNPNTGLPDIYESLLASQIYTGGGVIGRISRIDMLTKQFNFYVNKDRDFSVSRVNFQVDRTSNGQFTVDYLTSSSINGNLQDSVSSGISMGNGILETTPYADFPYEATATRLWHPVYMLANGEFIQLRIYMQDSQMLQPLITNSGFEMHAMIFYANPTSARLQ